MSENPLLGLRELGQSVWMDFIRRGTVTSGELERLIEEDGIRGVTSNPTIFEKAIRGSHDYDDAIRSLARNGKSAEEMYEALTVEDIQMVADTFRPVYDRLRGEDGFVSLEVSPHLAHDTRGTVEEARRLWSALSRPNVFIKVPATREGIPAIRQLIDEGINVNITLLFGLPRYEAVAEAYIAGLEARVARGEPVDRVASVASFFLSRIDVMIDPILEKKMQAGGGGAELAGGLRGQAAVASAKLAYQIYKKLFSEDRFHRLAAKGARTQRLLWASTSTKNPAYSDVKYVEPLIGPDTINTMPMETIDAYRDHGKPAPRIEQGVAEAHQAIQSLATLGIDLDTITQQLEDEGQVKFNKPYDATLETLRQKRDELLGQQVDRQDLRLADFQPQVEARIEALANATFGARLWRRDPTLWKSDGPSQEQVRGSLGWLHVAEKMAECFEELCSFVDEARQEGFQHVVHMGMGGSSLAPLVFERTFGPREGYLPLTVLDTTDPATILRIERSVPLEKTLFIVASKSGTTAEPSAFGEYFYDRVRAVAGERAGRNFVAITDPGSPLERQAAERGYRRTFLNFTDIGGRYSALSYFGLVPIALMGVDVEDLLDRTLNMVHACGSSVPASQNPGVTLGATMGELAKSGRDKLTLLVPPEVETLATWLEQLLAESTGKEGTGILPVAGEPVGETSVYGSDRLFVQVVLKGGSQESGPANEISALERAGQPVISIQLDSLMDLGQEFFRWEVATATAGAVLGINPFDQPNVQESKDITNRLLSLVMKQGGLPEERPTVTGEGLGLYLEESSSTVAQGLAQFLSQGRPCDYLALLAYLPETPEIDRKLLDIRLRLRDNLRLATTIGYGPRYLHSTGQYHKGGPNTGLFLQVTADDAEDVSIPGAGYTFGTLKRAQAMGDLEALRRHGRRAIRVHLGKDILKGLEALDEALQPILSVSP